MTLLARESPAALPRERRRPREKLSVLLAMAWDQESGGIASVAGYLGRYLEAHGHRVLFLHAGPHEIARRRKTTWGFDGVALNLRAPFLRAHPMKSVVGFLLTFPLTLLQLIRLLREHRIRIVNLHYPGAPFVYFAFCRALLPIRLVVSIHGMDVVPWGARRAELALRLLLRAADLVVAPSWGFLRQCNAVLSPSRASRIVIRNGIDLTELQSSGMAEPGEATSPFILSIASHDEWKGLDVLIRAVASLRDRGERVRLVLVGDGPMRPQLERLAQTLAVAQQVEFLGYQARSAVARLLQDCTLFVLPSRAESFGLTVVEALACGKPVIATAVGGIPEIIEDDTHGILVEPDDVGGLAAAIQRMLADPGLRERLGRTGRLRVEDAFRWERMGEGYERAYASLLEQRA